MNYYRAFQLAFFGFWTTASCLVFAASPETQRVYLSGRDKDHTVPWRFLCTSGANSGVWTNLAVPSHWDMHGFGTLTYKKDATNALDERGLYEHEFTVPADWKNRRIWLVFEGAMTDTSAQLNGQSVGSTHQGSFYRFKYEVTKLARVGASNRLTVNVARHSGNKSVNRAERDADYWVFAGIYRPVYLESVPEAFIERVAIDAKADGTFDMDAFADGAGTTDSIEAQILSLEGKAVGNPFRVSTEKGMPSFPSQKSAHHLTTQVADHRNWTAETPSLYSVEVRLLRGGKVLHQMNQRFGFRTMEVRDGDGLYVNGSKVILKGVNRHSFWPDSGRCLSSDVHRMDIETIKGMNGNAARMSHYPPDQEFLDLCDELGLYVLDELAGWQKQYDTDIGTQLAEEMVSRDVNHPCILLWDNGNEGGSNPNVDVVFGQFDPQGRRVMHPWSARNGVNTIHYLDYDGASRAATGALVNSHVDKRLREENPDGWIYLPTEFLHGLFDGGAGAGFSDYWSMMMSNRHCAGGFIWALVDEGVKMPDGTINTSGNEAPDGIVGPYRQREGSFYALKQIWSPIQVARDAAGVVTVRNGYHFTDASKCRFVWQWRQFPAPGSAQTNHIVLAEAVAKVPSIPPGGSGQLDRSYPPQPAAADTLALSVNDPEGKELWTWIWPVEAKSKAINLAGISKSGASAPTVQQKEDTIVLKTGGLRVTINKTSGKLKRVELNGKTISLQNGPRLVVGTSELKDIRVNESSTGADVTATFDGDLRSVTWRLQQDGGLQCRYSYHASGKQSAIGVLFDYPEAQVRSKRWLGEGPYRVWKNRLGGGLLNVWANDYNNTITGYRDWIYPEFKGCFSNVRWLQLETGEGTISVIPEGIPFVQVLTPELPPSKIRGHACAELPTCGLGFLNAIPPQGSKFRSADGTGPQGQLTSVDGDYNGAVTFYFNSKR